MQARCGQSLRGSGTRSMKHERRRKLNQAQHIWLAILTELAIERCNNVYTLRWLLVKHRKAAGLRMSYWP